MEFNFTVINRKLLLIATIPLLLLTLVGVYKTSDFFIDNGVEILVVVWFIPLLIIIGLLSKFFKIKYTLNMTDTDLSLKKEGKVLKSTQLNSILMIKHAHITDTSDTLIIYTDNKTESFISFNTVGHSEQIYLLLEKLLNSGRYKKNIRMDRQIQWNEYLNQSLLQNNVNNIIAINDGSRNLKKKLIWGSVAMFFLLIGILILPFFINPKEYYKDYTEKDGKLYYKDKEVIGFHPEEIKSLGISLVKDSSMVVYKGQILEWADAASFEKIEGGFYKDKNGIYYETSNLYSKNKIIPLDGDYDKNTFEAVGTFYKDKNHLYAVNYEVLDFSNSPISKIQIKDLDIMSFKCYNHSWYADNNCIYFYSQGNELKACPEIDRNSFEVLSFYVSKDKNNVYYLTRYLSSKDKAATRKSSYTILEGADAQTFEIIDDKHFADINTIWTISHPGEDEVLVQRRDNIE